MSTASTQDHCLAVLPFDDLSGNPDGAYLVRGFVEDVITELSRFRNLEVMSSHSSLLRGAATTGAQWAELGVGYLLRGTFRHAGGRLRINAQLVEAERDRLVWGERFDAALGEIFKVQDDIASQVVGAMFTQMDMSRLSRARRKPIHELEAYDCWLRGVAELRRGSLEGDERSRGFFEQALKCDPGNARAYAGLSLSYFNEWTCQLWERWDENEEKSLAYAVQAHELDESDHVVQVVLGRIYVYRRDWDRGDRHLSRALDLNSNDADNLVQICLSKSLLGQLDVAEEVMAKANRLNPYRDAWYNAIAAIPAFLARDHQRALDLANLAPPGHTVDLPGFKAACLAHLGRQAEAEQLAREYQESFEDNIRRGRSSLTAIDWIVLVNPLRSPEHEAHLIEGLERAGLQRAVVSSVSLGGPPSATFRVGDGVRHMSYAGRDVQLPEVKGFADIEALLRQPGVEIHVAELAGTVVANHDEDVLDDQAKAAYKEHIRQLRAEVSDAEANHDLGRRERANVELDQMVEHLAKASGLGGRTRKLGAPTQRARSAVTQRIKAAIAKIEKVHPGLGGHLRATIRTGNFCCYRTDITVDWQM